MPRYSNAATSYLDANGNPYSSGKLYFYDTGTTNLKTTYSDKAETTANANPVILDGAGRVPDIWFTDSAKVVLLDSNGVTIWSRDPVDADSTANAAYAAYGATVTYVLYDRVRATNNKDYQSLSASNLNNEPSISPTKWTEIRSLEMWNTNVAYSLGDNVVNSVGQFWRSLVGSNTGNTPGADTTNWASTTLSNVQPLQTASFTMVAGYEYTIEATSGAASVATPSIIADGDLMVLHNASTSTQTVDITTTLTIKGAGGTITSSDVMRLNAGDTARICAVSSNVMEVR